MDNLIGFDHTYPVDSDFPAEWHYPTFEHPSLDEHINTTVTVN